MYKNVLLNVKYVIWITIGIILLICFSFWLINGMEEKINGTKIDLSEEYINLSKYYASFDMTVISNKNINTYAVKETYEKDDKCTLEFLDAMKNNVTVTTENGTCTITNSNNALNLVAENLVLADNLASFSTFIKIYNLVDNECNCKKSVYKKQDETTITINLEKLCNCSKCGNIKNLGVSKLEVIMKSNVPVSYIVYDENKNEYISIVYNSFEI